MARNLPACIVVGVDGSEESTAALSWAYDEARLRGAELVVIFAWTYPFIGYRTGVDERRADVEAEAAKVLTQAVDECRSAKGGDVRIATRLVEESPAKALLDAGADAALVVVGSRGRGGFSSLLLGSVSHQVAQHATCPVVVVRRPDR